MARKRSYDTLIGGSVGWNQLVQSTAPSASGITNNGDGSFTVPIGTSIYFNLNTVDMKANHVYYHSTGKGEDSKCYFRVDNVNGSAMSSKATPGIWKYETNTSVTVSIRALNNTIECRVVPQLIDLTLLLGSTIADYIYSLETATAGAGIAKLREWGFIGDAYIPYDAGSIKSVEASAKVTRDASDNIIGNYPLDSSLTLRGIPKLTDGKLWYDGDRYESDGTVTRKYGIRAYQEGDETSDTMITDGTNTVYKLTSTTTESADPFTNPQMVDPDGTEEYVTANGVPVGHETRYQL